MHRIAIKRVKARLARLSTVVALPCAIERLVVGKQGACGRPSGDSPLRGFRLLRTLRSGDRA
jgi:hypothetical protein